jgi:hypothetical protein
VRQHYDTDRHHQRMKHCFLRGHRPMLFFHNRKI